MTPQAILLPLLFKARNPAELARLVGADHDRPMKASVTALFQRAMEQKDDPAFILTHFELVYAVTYHSNRDQLPHPPASARVIRVPLKQSRRFVVKGA